MTHTYEEIAQMVRTHHWDGCPKTATSQLLGLLHYMYYYGRESAAHDITDRVMDALLLDENKGVIFSGGRLVPMNVLRPAFSADDAAFYTKSMGRVLYRGPGADSLWPDCEDIDADGLPDLPF